MHSAQARGCLGAKHRCDCVGGLRLGDAGKTNSSLVGWQFVQFERAGARVASDSSDENQITREKEKSRVCRVLANSSGRRAPLRCR